MRRAARYVLAAVVGAAMTTLGAGNLSFAAATSLSRPYAVAGVLPAAGEVVGVGHPVVVSFVNPIVDRAGAERTIKITSPTNVAGRFDWVDDDVVQWVPDKFWPAHTEVTFLAGGAPTQFETGAAVVGVADISAHTFTVSIDDQVMREMPASMGKPKFPTPIGSFSALRKERVVVMDSRTIGIPLEDPEGYKLTVEHAVRVTSGGVYVHGAPWSVGSQGYANVSHGCINISPANAAWYFDTVRVGDPVIVQS